MLPRILHLQFEFSLLLENKSVGNLIRWKDFILSMFYVYIKCILLSVVSPFEHFSFSDLQQGLQFCSSDYKSSFMTLSHYFFTFSTMSKNYTSTSLSLTQQHKPPSFHLCFCFCSFETVSLHSPDQYLTRGLSDLYLQRVQCWDYRYV